VDLKEQSQPRQPPLALCRNYAVHGGCFNELNRLPVDVLAAVDVLQALHERTSRGHDRGCCRHHGRFPT
jgi:hypothetical protein